MKTVAILRHAKSSWAQPGLTDFDRPLNERGQAQLVTMGDWIAENALRPDLILCSPARRTRETHAGLENALDGARMRHVDDLYEGDLDDYLGAIWTAPTDVETLMMIGHNPTCDELVRFLAKPSSPAYEQLLRHHFGTATLAILRFSETNWPEVANASGSLDHFLRPKALEEAAD